MLSYILISIFRDLSHFRGCGTWRYFELIKIKRKSCIWTCRGEKKNFSVNRLRKKNNKQTYCFTHSSFYTCSSRLSSYWSATQNTGPGTLVLWNWDSRCLYFLEVLKARKHQPKNKVRCEGKKPRALGPSLKLWKWLPAGRPPESGTWRMPPGQDRIKI